MHLLLSTLFMSTFPKTSALCIIICTLSGLSLSRTPPKTVCLFYSGSIPVSHSDFGGGSGAILTYGMTCSGTEEKILNCSHGGLGLVPPSCDHSTDVGVICAGV